MALAEWLGGHRCQLNQSWLDCDPGGSSSNLDLERRFYQKGLIVIGSLGLESFSAAWQTAELMKLEVIVMRPNCHFETRKEANNSVQSLHQFNITFSLFWCTSKHSFFYLRRISGVVPWEVTCISMHY